MLKSREKHPLTLGEYSAGEPSISAPRTTEPKQPCSLGSSQVESAPGMIAPLLHQKSARNLPEECGLKLPKPVWPQNDSYSV